MLVADLVQVVLHGRSRQKDPPSAMQAVQSLRGQCAQSHAMLRYRTCLQQQLCFRQSAASKCLVTCWKSQQLARVIDSTGIGCRLTMLPDRQQELRPHLAGQSLVTLQPVCFVTDQQITGLWRRKPQRMQSEGLVGDDKHLHSSIYSFAITKVDCALSSLTETLSCEHGRVMLMLQVNAVEICSTPTGVWLRGLRNRVRLAMTSSREASQSAVVFKRPCSACEAEWVPDIGK